MIDMTVAKGGVAVSGTFDQVLALLDDIYARFRRRSFPVGQGPDAVSQWVADELSAWGYVRMRLHEDARVIDFRVVPDRRSVAPYRLVPIVENPNDPQSPGWIGSFTHQGMALVAPPTDLVLARIRARLAASQPLFPQEPVAGSSPSPEAPRRTAGSSATLVVMHTQPSLDLGAWGPEQATIAELLAPVSGIATGSSRRRISGFFGR
jgi:hypothetical protein